MTNHSRAFVALGDPTRQIIFERLARRPMPVGKLAAGLGVTRPAVSQHLKVLKDAGLVTARQDGTRRVYQIDPRGVEVMRNYLDRFWDREHGRRTEDDARRSRASEARAVWGRC